MLESTENIIARIFRICQMDQIALLLAITLQFCNLYTLLYVKNKSNMDFISLYIIYVKCKAVHASNEVQSTTLVMPVSFTILS